LSNEVVALASRDVLGKIKDAAPDLSRGERLVAAYVADNYQRAAFFSAEELGAEVGVSDTTVVRLAQSLGYKGFAELRRELQELVRQRVTPKAKLTDTISQLAGTENFAIQSYHLDLQNLNRSFAEIDMQTLEQVATVLAEARTVFVVGLGLSAAAVQFTCYRLRRTGAQVVDASSGGYTLIGHLASMEAGDAMLVFDFPRYSREALAAMRHARSRGVPTILVTDSLVSPLQEFADRSILAFNNCLGFTNSLVGTVFIANVITLAVLLKRQERSLESAEQLESLVEELGHCL